MITLCTLRSEDANGEACEVERAERRVTYVRLCKHRMNLQSQVSHPQRRIPIDKLSDLSRKRTLSRCNDQVTNTINISARNRARHQVSLTYAPPLLSMPTRSRSSIGTGSHSGGSLTEENRAALWSGEELADQGTSFGRECKILQRLLTDLMRCRPRDINRRPPR